MLCVQLDMFVYCLVMISLQRKDSATAQLLAGALLQLVFMGALWWHSPFLQWRQGLFEYLIKAQVGQAKLLRL